MRNITIFFLSLLVVTCNGFYFRPLPTFRSTFRHCVTHVTIPIENLVYTAAEVHISRQNKQVTDALDSFKNEMNKKFEEVNKKIESLKWWERAFFSVFGCVVLSVGQLIIDYLAAKYCLKAK